MKQRQLPFGYTLRQGQTLQHEKEAAVIQCIFNAYIEGASYLAIATTLSAGAISYHEGKPEWNKHMVKRILENSRYLGTDKYPEIISKETFLLAGNIRGEKSRPITSEDDQPHIIPEQAEVVRRIFESYLAGMSVARIKKMLEAEGIPAAGGKPQWSEGALQYLLRNEKYCGDALLQKTFVEDCMNKKTRKNNVVCGDCGTAFRRVTWAKRGKKKVVWRCISRLDYGTKYCKHSPTIEEERLHGGAARHQRHDERPGKAHRHHQNQSGGDIIRKPRRNHQPPAHRKQAGRVGSHSERADCDHHKGKNDPSIRSPIQGDFG